MKTLKLTVSDVRKTLETALLNAVCNDDIYKALESKGLKCPMSVLDFRMCDPEEQVEYLCMWNNIG